MFDTHRLKDVCTLADELGEVGSVQRVGPRFTEECEQVTDDSVVEPVQQIVQKFLVLSIQLLKILDGDFLPEHTF